MHSGSRVAELEFDSQLQLHEPGPQNSAARIQASEQVGVCRPAVPLRVRVKGRRIQVEGTIEDVPVKGVDDRSSQENIYPFGHVRSLGEVEILTEELRVAHISNGPRHGTELVSVGTEIAPVVGVGECLAVKHRIGHRIEMPTQILLAEDLSSFN
jgi:hypothetical protein